MMMHIKEVISYLGAWEKINHDYHAELFEVVLASSTYYRGEVIREDSDHVGPWHPDMARWQKSFLALGWSPQAAIEVCSPDGEMLKISSLGPTKNKVTASYSHSNRMHLPTWLYRFGVLAFRYRVTEIPIYVCLINDNTKDTDISAGILFKEHRDLLASIAPLSLPFPFLILGLAEHPFKLPVKITSLNADPNIRSEQVVIDRSIEFPLEYHQAGVGILSYFSTYLRESYPERQAKVRIEQQGLAVRMTIEASDGSVETVEKALWEFDLVITGRAKPETIARNEKILLDLRNELRIAQLRIESQQDIIAVQDKNIDKLMTIIGDGLNIAQARPISLNISPAFNNNQSVRINSSISVAINQVTELLESLPPTAEAEEMAIALKDLSRSLEAVEYESDPIKIRESAGISKLGRFLKRLQAGNTEFVKAIDSFDKGRKLVTGLISTYNRIALICGLPSIPWTQAEDT
jgi:hypothetical protein